MTECTNSNEPLFTKPPYDSLDSMVRTDLGRLRIRGPISPEKLESYRLSDGLNCFRASCRQHQALIDLAKQNDGMIFVAEMANTIISYVSFQKPDYPWWQERCFPELIELGGLETDPAWRKMGLTKALLNSLFLNREFNYFEDYIVIAVQFIHSWDLKNIQIAPWAYREFMINLFSKYGFVSWETVDPEVREHPCNILLARVGCNVKTRSVKHFDYCCLGTQGSESDI